MRVPPNLIPQLRAAPSQPVGKPEPLRRAESPVTPRLPPYFEHRGVKFVEAVPGLRVVIRNDVARIVPPDLHDLMRLNGLAVPRFAHEASPPRGHCPASRLPRRSEPLATRRWMGTFMARSGFSGGSCANGTRFARSCLSTTFPRACRSPGSSCRGMQVLSAARASILVDAEWRRLADWCKDGELCDDVQFQDFAALR